MLLHFFNNSSDIDNRTNSDEWGDEKYKYKWTIEDYLLDGSDNTKEYNLVDYDYTPTHSFQSPGTKNITLELFLE